MAEDPPIAREPFVVTSHGLAPEIVAELEAAFHEQRTVRFDDRPWLVQELGEHLDPGAGEMVKSFELIPAREDDEDDLGADTLETEPLYDEDEF